MNSNLKDSYLNKKRERVRTTFNDRMNPKNKYFKNPPDFKILSEKHPEFRKYIKKVNENYYTIDWKDSNALKELCRVLLLNDYNIQYWEIPDGYLIPSITGRCNYIHWIHDLLEEDCIQNSELITGIDIGCGANCIYPLLGNKIYKWKYVCSEVNSMSIEIANRIINKNNLTEEINIIHQTNSKYIYKNILSSTSHIYFSMCNPPYFSFEEKKHDNPNTSCEYTSQEVYCEGGEYKFIKKMIKESKIFQNNVIWFTTLVGKKSNLNLLLEYLAKIKEIKRIKDITFYQGKLARWGLAWSYYDKDIKSLTLIKPKQIFESKIRIKHNKNKLIK